jgi:TolA-binding protein
MTELGRLPEVPASALRDAATEERVERVWRRIEGDLGGAAPRSRYGTAVWAWAPAAAIAVFAGGWFAHAAFVGNAPQGPWGMTPERIAPPVGLNPNPEVRQAPAQPSSVPEKIRPHGRAPLHLAPLPVLPVEQAVPNVPAPAAPGAAQPEWQIFYTDGEFSQAHDAIDRQGGFGVVIAHANAEQLMLLSEIARFSGNFGSAIAALQRLCDVFPKDPNVPDALLQLANLLRKAGDGAGAAQAAAAYLALSPNGDFSEDALASLVEGALERGDPEIARQLAEQYVREFPAGERVEEFRALLGPAPTPVPAPAPAPSAAP